MALRLGLCLVQRLADDDVIVGGSGADTLDLSGLTDAGGGGLTLDDYCVRRRR